MRVACDQRERHALEFDYAVERRLARCCDPAERVVLERLLADVQIGEVLGTDYFDAPQAEALLDAALRAWNAPRQARARREREEPVRRVLREVMRARNALAELQTIAPEIADTFRGHEKAAVELNEVAGIALSKLSPPLGKTSNFSSWLARFDEYTSEASALSGRVVHFDTAIALGAVLYELDLRQGKLGQDILHRRVRDLGRKVKVWKIQVSQQIPSIRPGLPCADRDNGCMTRLPDSQVARALDEPSTEATKRVVCYASAILDESYVAVPTLTIILRVRGIEEEQD